MIFKIQNYTFFLHFLLKKKEKEYEKEKEKEMESRIKSFEI